MFDDHVTWPANDLMGNETNFFLRLFVSVSVTRATVAGQKDLCITLVKGIFPHSACSPQEGLISQLPRD